VPVAIIGGFGLIYVVFGLFAFVLMSWLIATGEPMYSPGPSDPIEAGVVGISCVVAGFWVLFAAL
jgi:hypothetical protein